MNPLHLVALNVNHRTLRPRSCPVDLLDALLATDADVVFLNEWVETPAWLEALAARWPYVESSAHRPYGAGGRVHNQVLALSHHPLSRGAGTEPLPTPCAATNFLAVEVGGWQITGLRAPAYVKAADWYAYWEHVRLEGDVVIGDLNIRPRLGRKRDRVIPEGWRTITPEGVSYRNLARSPDRGSALDHALVREHVRVADARYLAGFLGRWSLDHAPIAVRIERL